MRGEDYSYIKLDGHASYQLIIKQELPDMTSLPIIVSLCICGLYFVHRLTDNSCKVKFKLTIGKILELSRDE